MKRSVLFFFLLMGCLQLCAQPTVDNDKGVLWQFETRNAFRSSSDGVKMQSIEPEIAIGYRFTPCFSLFVPLTGTLGLFEREATKTWERTLQVGLGVGYAPLRNPHDRLGIELRSGATVDGAWKFVYYDCGLRWQSDVIWAPLYVGAGVRYYDTYGGGFPNYCNFYICAGVTILNRFRSGK